MGERHPAAGAERMFGPHPDYPDETAARCLGYWRNRDRRRTRDVRPEPAEFVDPGWDPAARAAVVAYLRAGETLYDWIGSSTCRVCGLRPNGRRCLTDGVFAWPEGLAHYVEAHGVRPPDAFVRHARGASR